MQYLGALLSADGRLDSEISRKLGTARADFNQLQRVWGHSNVPLAKKIQYFRAFVVSKLCYGLSTVWLVKAQRRRLDGFVARCLRRILHIPAAFVSRIPNAVVFAKAGVRPLTEQLLKHQLCLLHKAANTDAGSPLRRDTFVDASLNPQVGRFVRRVGRPRLDWTNQLLQEGSNRMGITKFQRLLSDRSIDSDKRWKQEVEKLFR